MSIIQYLSTIPLWLYIIGFIILIDIWCLCTLKIKPIWTYRQLKTMDLLVIQDRIIEMDDREFEEFIAYLFHLDGHKTQLTSPTADMGRDVIIDNDIFIECKHYSSNNNGSSSYVGRPVIQKLLGSMQMFGAKKGIIINTGKYHKNAIEASKMVDNIELWSMKDIIKLVKKLNTSKIIKYLGYDEEYWIERLNQ